MMKFLNLIENVSILREKIMILMRFYSNIMEQFQIIYGKYLSIENHFFRIYFNLIHSVVLKAKPDFTLNLKKIFQSMINYHIENLFFIWGPYKNTIINFIEIMTSFNLKMMSSDIIQ